MRVVLVCIAASAALFASIVSAEEAKTKTEAVKTEAALLRPFYPLERARRALTGFMTKMPERLPGEEGLYRASIDCELWPKARCGHGRWDLGDLTGRSLLAWAALREMTGDDVTGREVEEGQRKFLLSILHPETGLAWWEADKKTGTYKYEIWDQSRALRGLARWYETRPADRPKLQPVIQRMIRGLDTFATLRGTDPTWGPYAGWPSDEYTNDKPGPAWRGHFVNNRAGICIEPLVMYATASGDPKALDLAVRFANCELGGHQGDPVPPEQRHYFRFGPDGSFAGHYHTKAGMLVGIAKLSRWLAAHGRMGEARQYLHEVRKSYEWIFAENNHRRGSRIGWLPETPGHNIHETCCAADTIELAEALAGCSSLGGEFQDWARLHDDVEAMTVNAIACIQLRFTPELEKTLSNLYGQDAEKHLEIARRLDGAWAATIQNGDLVQHGNDREFINMMGCCQYAGVRALYTGWRDAMTAGDGRLYINYFMNRRSPQAAMTTETPVKGEAQIALREPAEVFVRVPGWLKPEQMTIDVGGESVNPTDHLDLGRQYVALGRPAVGTKILVRFPLEERTASEKFGGRTYAVRWRGNYVVGFSPLGMKTPIVPIFSGPFGR